MSETKTHPGRSALALLALLTTIGFGWLAGRPARCDEGLPAVNSDLGGEERYLLHLSTDKPVYRPGEMIYITGALLEAFTHVPAPDVQAPQIKIISPRGDAVTTGFGGLLNGSMSFAWSIPRGIAGGEYKVVATIPSQGYPPAERSFRINAYRVPRLRTDLQFARKAYGPGDEVRAILRATRAEGGIPARAPVQAVATVDGGEVYRSSLALDPSGALAVTFTLPSDIKVGDGTLALAISDGGVQESAVKSIPIVIHAVSVALYPEGGDLIAGIPTRLYVESRTPKALPADLVGRIVDDAQHVVASVRTEHEGRGRVTFTPQAGKTYSLMVDQPAGIKAPFALPKVEARGYVLGSTQDVIPAGEAVRLSVAATGNTHARVVLSQREREVASTGVDLEAGVVKEVTLTPGSTADGVLRATIVDSKGRPRAERLVFRRPEHRLTIALACDPKRSEPGGKVKVKVRCMDERERPVKATVEVAVVDDALLETIDKRERAPRLPAQVFLEGEVQELADAHVYLGEGADAARDLDLLLGTQGWRRFAFQDPSAFVGKFADKARRVLALREPPPEQLGMGGEDGAARGGMAFRLNALEAPRAPRVLERVGRVMHLKAAQEPQPDEDMEKEEVLKVKATPVDALKGAPAPAMAVPVPAGEPPASPVPEAAAGMVAQEPVLNMGLANMRGRKAWFGAVLDQREPPSVIRVYAHQGQPGKVPGKRSDFTETVYWNSGLVTDEKGEGSFELALSDSITTFRVMADAFSAGGALGQADATVESRQPFYAEAKMPLEVTAGDRIDLPVALVNGTAGPLAARLSLDLGAGLRLASEPPSGVTLAPDGRTRVIVPILVGSAKEDAALRVHAVAGGEVAELSRALPTYGDDVTRRLPIVPSGFPVELSFGGKLEGKIEHGVSIPMSIDVASLHAQAVVYPSPAASLTQAVQALLREPGGCFEQTSSSNYPNAMALWYFKSHHVDDPSIIERAGHMLDDGYKKLVGFECKQKGYEWFGGDPGHEALTAYGVLEFTDMARVYPVDPAMLDRTREWLLGRRDGKGGFQRNPRALDSFGGAPQEITDAYITWALTEAGQKDLEPELAHVRSLAEGSDDPYLLALAANALATVKAPAAEVLMKKLATHQQPDGVVSGAATSITRSSGEALDIETTALAVMAWLKSSSATATCEKSAQWLLTRCKDGRFGSTQSTILALKAIIAFDEAHATPKRAGSVLLWIDGKVVEESSFQADRQGPITFPKFTDRLTPGDHKIGLSMVGGAPMPYSITVRYHALTPASAPGCKVGLQTALGRRTVAEGETVDLSVTVQNRTPQGLPMTIAIIGLPAGLEARAEQLKELQGSGQIDFFETRAREVILYWRQMAPSAKRSLVINLVAAIPGKFTGPASRAYLYYTDEQKDWADGLGVEITHR